MLIEILIALLVGILAGTITGLIPGIHVNLIGAILISSSATIIFQINPIYFVVFISSMAITHTFVDFLPSIFLGCPDTDTELSILPGHELLKEGRGYEAAILTNKGSLGAIFILILIALPSIFLLSKINSVIIQILPFLLIAVSFFLIFSEKKKSSALFVFLFSGALGLIVLNLPGINQPILPLLTGLFGASALLLSIKSKPLIPKQELYVEKTPLLKPLLGASLVAPFFSFLPGLGSGQAAVIGNAISKTDKKGFLTLLGATNTFVMGFSFISLYALSRTRTGAAIAINEIFGILNYKVLILILGSSLISGILAFFIVKKLAKILAQNIHKIKYSKISFVILIIVTLIVFLVSGLKGLAILITATLTGIYCISLKVRRTNMMGCLLIPTIIFYLF